MEPDQNPLASLFPNISAQLRSALSNLHLAAAQLAPASAREQDPALDARAALLDQSYYQMLRLVSSLSAAGRYVAVLSGEELYIYDKQLALCAQLEEVSQAREVLMRSDGSAVLAGSTAASLYLP